MKQIKPENFDKKNIEMYLHCQLCAEELPAEESPESYARFSIGWTVAGLQVWCVRHDVNIIHIDFEGTQHKACMTREKIYDNEKEKWI